VVSQSADSVSRSGLRKGKERLSLLIGYNGLINPFGEIGISRNRLDIVGAHPLGRSYFVSTEVKFDDRIIIGPKIGGWFGGGVGAIAMGLNTVVYTDFEDTSWRLRPEVGFGLASFKIVYGYNFSITNKDFRGINDHNFSLVVLLPLKTIKAAEK
jgi:hypothetical protein